MSLLQMPDTVFLSFAWTFAGSGWLLLDLALKGSVVLFLAWACAWLVRGESAATRHLVWAVGLWSALVIPLFSTMLPQWQVLPQWLSVLPVAHEVELSVAKVVAAEEESRGAASAVSAASEARPSTASGVDQQGAEEKDVLNAMAARAPVRSVTRASAPGHALSPSSADSAAQRKAESLPEQQTWWRLWLSSRWPGVLWAAGVMLILLRVLVACIHLRRIERCALLLLDGRLATAGQASGSKRAVTDNSVHSQASEIRMGTSETNAEMRAEFQKAQIQLELRQNVRLLLHPGQIVPQVWGVGHPRLLLPAVARDWSRAQRRSVLLHELAHLKRRDPALQLMSQLSCAVYWFHPLIWLAAWRLQQERERACDDLVLHAGVKSSDYAEHLLNIADWPNKPDWQPVGGLAMARQSSLCQRLTAVLNHQQQRCSVSRFQLLLTVILAASVTVPLAVLRANPAERVSGNDLQSVPTDTTQDGAHDGGAVPRPAQSSQPHSSQPRSSQPHSSQPPSFSKTHTAEPSTATVLPPATLSLPAGLESSGMPEEFAIKLDESLRDLSARRAEASSVEITGNEYQVFHRPGRFDLGKGRVLNLAGIEGDGNAGQKRDEHPYWYDIEWPATGPWPASRLRLVPTGHPDVPSGWALAWKADTDELWFVDQASIGRLDLADPAAVVMTTEGRENNFSRDLGLTDTLKNQFRRLGFVIGRDRTPGREMLIGGNVASGAILSATTIQKWTVRGTVTAVNGRPMADIPVRVRSQYYPTSDVVTAITDGSGVYQVSFSLNLRTLALWRGVMVEPVLPGFTERDLARNGEFTVLLSADEQPQRVAVPESTHGWGSDVGESGVRPGPIESFSPQTLVQGETRTADFVMKPAVAVTGRLLDAAGAAVAPHFISISAVNQRPGYHVAWTNSEQSGGFRLIDVPTNMPLVISVNPVGSPSEEFRSKPVRFDSDTNSSIVMRLPAAGSGDLQLQIVGGAAEPVP